MCADQSFVHSHTAGGEALTRGPEHRRALSLLVHIAFHYVPHRWQYLERVLSGLTEFELERLVVVIDSNTNDVRRHLASLALPKHVTVRVDVHTELAHPFDLTWAHRKHMASVLDSFDYFMYLEDDIYVPWQTFDAWLRRAESVSGRGFIHGFLRVEFDRAGCPISSDWRSAAHRPTTIEIAGTKYIRPEWFYHACWAYSRATMQHFVRTIAWRRGFHRWSSEIRRHRHDGNYTREFSAFGMACAAPGRPRVLLPVDDQGRVPADAWVFHLPNNYAQDANLGHLNLLNATRLVEGGLGPKRPFDFFDRAIETRRWAGYLLYLNEALQLARRCAKRFLFLITGGTRYRRDG